MNTLILFLKFTELCLQRLQVFGDKLKLFRQILRISRNSHP
jgi:hypothetical protein